MVVADCHLNSSNHRIMLWSDQGHRVVAYESYNSILAALRILHHCLKAIVHCPRSAPVVQTVLRIRQLSPRLVSPHLNYQTINKRITTCPLECISSNNSSATIHFSCQDSLRTQRRQPPNTSETAPWISQLIVLEALNSRMNTPIFRVRQKLTT